MKFDLSSVSSATAQNSVAQMENNMKKGDIQLLSFRRRSNFFTSSFRSPMVNSRMSDNLGSSRSNSLTDLHVLEDSNDKDTPPAGSAAPQRDFSTQKSYDGLGKSSSASPRLRSRKSSGSCSQEISLKPKVPWPKPVVKFPWKPKHMGSGTISGSGSKYKDYSPDLGYKHRDYSPDPGRKHNPGNCPTSPTPAHSIFNVDSTRDSPVPQDTLDTTSGSGIAHSGSEQTLKSDFDVSDISPDYRNPPPFSDGEYVWEVPVSGLVPPQEYQQVVGSSKFYVGVSEPASDTVEPDLPDPIAEEKVRHNWGTTCIHILLILGN